MAPQKTSSKVTSDKLSPSAYDRWWRDRIEKEEGKSGAEDRAAAKTATLKLNSLGGVQEVLIAGDHLMGAGAMVKPLKPKQAEAGAEAPQEAHGMSGSQAGSRSKAGSLAAVETQPIGKAGSVALSHASYPKTSNLSQAGGSVTSSVIMTRLQRLEQELVRERVRREAAEREMTDLMTVAAHLTTAPARS